MRCGRVGLAGTWEHCFVIWREAAAEAHLLCSMTWRCGAGAPGGMPVGGATAAGQTHPVGVDLRQMGPTYLLRKYCRCFGPHTDWVSLAGQPVAYPNGIPAGGPCTDLASHGAEQWALRLRLRQMNRKQCPKSALKPTRLRPQAVGSLPLGKPVEEMKDPADSGEAQICNSRRSSDFAAAC